MVKLINILFLLIITCSFVHAQESVVDTSKQFSRSTLEYDNDLLPTSFFESNRNELRKLMPANSVAVIFANPIKNRSNDVDFQYHQDPNFYYLTGLREPNAMIIIFKDIQEFGDGMKTDEILFLQSRNKSDETWTGKRLGAEQVVNYLGIKSALNNKEFQKFNPEFETFDKIFVGNILDEISTKSLKEELFKMMHEFYIKTKFCELNIDKNTFSNQFLPKLRQVKMSEELVLLQKAIDITCDAQIELMKSVNSKMSEFQAQAIVEYVFKSNGAEYPGFPTIMGGGENSCILHYTTNRKPFTGNDLVVSDIGAEYHGYTADITRTLPTNGKFSEEQKIIYNIVLEAQNAGIQQCKKENKFWAPHDAATKVIASRLLELGIIDKSYKVKEYFMHGTSHYLGLDVHDAGLFGSLELGNVITVEPGIYIPEGSNCDPKWWNIGVRIEDDILITDGEPVILSKKAPREIEEIKLLMLEVGKFEN